MARETDDMNRTNMLSGLFAFAINTRALRPSRTDPGLRSRWAGFKGTLGIAGMLAGLFISLPLLAQFGNTQLRVFCPGTELGLEPSSGLIQGSDGFLYGTTSLGGGTLKGTVFKLNPDGTGFTPLHSFTGTALDGTSPYAGLTEGTDHNLYGTTWSGGDANGGTVFKLGLDGSGYQVLHSFTGGATDGANSYAEILEGSDGALYGTTHYGGSTNQGVIFKLNKDGTGYQVVHHFTGKGGDGSQPSARLIEGRDGMLYGTTYFGGSSNLGTVFKLSQDGSGFTVIHSFKGGTAEGTSPYAGLIQGLDGQLYGTTTFGGATNIGTVFKLMTDGSEYSVLHSFAGSGAAGAQPYAALLQGADGALYGTTSYGGTTNQGIVFRIETGGGNFNVLRSFTGVAGDAAAPYSALIRGSDGALYGTTYAGGSRAQGTVFKLNEDGGGYAVVHSFIGTGDDAATPYAGLLEGSDGALYGTTWNGGNTNLGTVYRLNKDSTGYALLHNFTGAGGDGANPYTGLIEAQTGALYGTTAAGGTATYGTIFKLNKDGSGYGVIHSFSGTTADGAAPYGTLIEGADGQLYGTTAFGGAGNLGTVYKLKQDGTGFLVIHSFTGTAGSGTEPYAGVIQLSNGLLYGVTAFGGVSNVGTIFRLGTNGSGYALLRSFTGVSGDGAIPYAALFKGSDGVLYGTTYAGGVTNQGTVFKLNQDGSGYSVMRRFTGGAGDGLYPSAGASLVEGSDSALYGATYSGGSTNQGTVFKINHDGSGFALVLSFTGAGDDGANPYGGMMKSRDGAFYGTTQNGGVGCGTVFRIVPAATFSITSAVGMNLSGPAGFRFTVQYLGQLGSPASWLNLTNITLASGPSPITDPTAGSATQRYYRAVLNP